MDEPKAPDVGDIEQAKVPEPSNGSMARDEAKLFEHEDRKHKRSLGAIGWFFGDKSEKSGNISALVIVLCFCIIGYLIFALFESDKFEKVFSGILSVITLVLGYIFGSTGRSDS